MKKRVVEILREKNLTYMWQGREVINYVEEKDGKRCHSRIDVPQTLEIEEGYDFIGQCLIDGENKGFTRPIGACVGLNLCDCMFDSDSKPIFRDRNQHIEEMKERVYIGILQTVCKYQIQTINKINICVEWQLPFVYVKGWIMTD